MTGKPLDGSKPVTNGQIADAINRAHDCIHNVGARVDALAVTVGKNRTDAADRDQALGERMSRVEGALGVATRPGRRVRRVRTKLAGLSLWQGVFSLMASMAGAAALYKFIEPAVIAGAIALRQALLHAG